MSRSDLVAVVESAYAIDSTEPEWLRELATRLPSPLGANGVAAFCVSLGGSPTPRNYLEVGAVPEFHRTVVAEGHRMMPDPGTLDRMYRGLRIDVASRLLGAEPDNWAFVQAMFRRGGFEDCAALLAYDGGSETAVFTSYVTSPLALGRRDRAMWQRVGAHISAGLRLRRRLRALAQPERLASGEAVLHPDGRLAHASHAAQLRSARESLRAAVRAADRARAKLRRTDPERALALWHGLVAGRWSLIDHFDSDGRRFVVAFRNAPEPQRWRRLSAAERQVIEYASVGLSNKEIAYVLGRSSPTVSTHLANGLRKLGLTRSDLCTLAGELSGRTVRRVVVLDHDIRVDAVSSPLEEAAWMSRLSPAEQDVARRAIEGQSNAEIARARGCSVRTIANQMASIFRKVGVGSRAELAAAHARGKRARGLP